MPSLKHTTEASVAGLSGCMDVRQLSWITPVLDQVGLPPNWLPRIVRAGTDLGPLWSVSANELGLPRSCRFVVGCLDQYAGAIGTGSIRPGRVTETTGTVLAVVRCADRFETKPRPGVFQGPAFEPGLFFEMSFSSTSANLLEWYRNQHPNRPEYNALTALAAAEPRGAGGLMIKPARDGQPLDQCFVNVTDRHLHGQVVRAIMERVALSLAEQVATLCQKRLPEQITSTGGGARSALWEQIKADTLGTRFVVTTCDEPTSLSAAMLAARALGHRSLSELADTWIHPRATFAPSAPHVTEKIL